MQNVLDKISRVSRNAMIIAITSLISRLLGLFRDRVLASEFGAGSVLDSYYAAFRIPDFVFNLIILGALSAALIPIFSSLLFKDKKKAWEVVNNFASVSVVILLAILAVLFFIAPWLVEVMTPGFGPEQLTNTVLLTRIMLLSPLFFALSSIVGGVLNSFGRFFTYSIAPIIYNIGIICGALYLVPVWGIAGLAWGVIFGAIGHFLIQIPTLIGTGYRPSISFNLRDEYFKKILLLMLPVTFGLALVQINLFVDNIVGSYLEPGSIAIINLATNLVSLPVGLVGVSLAVSVFPLLSYAHSQKKNDVFADQFTQTFNLALYLLIPAMVLMILFRAHIVRLVLGAGLFDVADTVWTARALGYLSMSLVAQGLIPFLVRTFYSMEDTVSPVKIMFFAVLVNIIADIVFTTIIPFKVVGLALGSTIAAFINLSFLLSVLKSRLKELDFERILLPAGKYMVLSVFSGILAYKTLYWIAPYLDTLTTLGLFYQTLIAGTIGLVAYLALSAMFRVPEAERLIRLLAKVVRIGRR